MINIGRVVSVFLNKVQIEVYNDLIDGIIVQDNKLHNILSVGGYCKIYNNNEFLIVHIINETANFLQNTDISKKIKDNYYKVIEGKIIGSIKKENGIFEFGISKMPNIFSSVFSLSNGELIKILNSQSKNNVLQKFGTFLQDSDVNFHLDVNDFLKFHSAIFGITGSGKSNTIGKVLETISLVEKNKQYKRTEFLKIILFDITGEYKIILEKNLGEKKLLSGLSINEYKIPIDQLNYKDWSFLLFASPKTQEPFLKSLDSSFKKINNWIEFQSTIVRTIFYTMKDFANMSRSATEQDHKLKVIRDGLKDIVSKKSVFYSYFQNIAGFFNELTLDFGKPLYKGSQLTNVESTIINDIKNIQLNIKKTFFKNFEIFNILFKLFEIRYQMFGGNMFNNIKSLIQRYERFNDELSSIFMNNLKEKNLINFVFDSENTLINIFDLSNVNFYITTGMAGLITSKLYNQKKEKKNGKLILFFDEAHKYMDSYNSDDYENNTEELFNEISKEGRKFGVSLIIASQKPSDISETLLSQCSNFIIHKITSHTDINKISKVISYLDEQSLEILSYLKPGCAVFAGRFQELPQIVKIQQPSKEFEPDSHIDDIYSLEI
ncbi:MAG: ATP-binding protein [Spiroplasma phoeniceum]|nr:MAG: ATP-binding protein [Spiroplasma phoeniceum]UZQ32963.1 MAG: ATP-binding protein [Spiroplasma phoeniceum]